MNWNWFGQKIFPLIIPAVAICVDPKEIVTYLLVMIIGLEIAKPEVK